MTTIDHDDLPPETIRVRYASAHDDHATEVDEADILSVEVAP